MSFDFANCRTMPHRTESGHPPAFAEPNHPTEAELARLVRELFREGALSCDQLWSLACLPEFAPLLSGCLGTGQDVHHLAAAE